MVLKLRTPAHTPRLEGVPRQKQKAVGSPAQKVSRQAAPAHSFPAGQGQRHPVRDRTCYPQVSVSRTGAKCCPNFPSAPKDTVDGPQVSNQQDVAEKLEDELS